jgi:hypothetical protein
MRGQMFRLFVLLAAMIWGAIAHAEPVFQR